jgi:hypothetical protein
MSLEKTEALTTLCWNITIKVNATTSQYLGGQLKSAWSGQ